ncbi:MAG: hypothetical protein MK437_02640, partial [SAR324 cluster bacterium]|nr:hypothetical protein [SAR324 cluster bacterium]
LIKSSEKSTLGLAAWMGKPDQPGYIEAQAKYLELETKVVTQICDELELSSESDDKVIIDTTGSLIYLEPQLIKRIKKLSFLVYLRLEENSSQSHYQIFIDDPKPVIWGKHYSPEPGEKPEASLRRCYPELSSFRDQEYECIADCTLEYSFHHHPETCPSEMLDAIQNMKKNAS